MNRPIHPFLLSAKQRDGISVGNSFPVNRQIRLHSSDPGISSQAVSKSGLYFVEDQEKSKTVCQLP